MKPGTKIIWNGKPHTFEGYTTARYGFRKIEAIISDGQIFFGVAVKDAFNKMEHQILTTI